MYYMDVSVVILTFNGQKFIADVLNKLDSSKYNIIMWIGTLQEPTSCFQPGSPAARPGRDAD